jgi:cardiolipin synthase C
MTGWLFWLVAAAALLAAASWLALWSYGRFARQARGAPSAAIPAGQGGTMDVLIPDGPDAAALSLDAAEALALRLASADAAARSVDVMTYIWSGDRSGRMLASALARAAGRGVRVRILLDDVNLWGRDPPWLALDRVPGIEVRIFNPVRTRKPGLARGLEMLLLALSYNRRMHGKLWAVDGRLAVVGGRNLGDVYFDLGRGRRRNVADADMLLTGSGPGGIVAQTATVFDDFWNSGQALPIASLWRGRLPIMSRHRQALPADGSPPGLRDPDAERAALMGILSRRRHGGRLTLIADPSDKALGLRPGPRGGRGWLPDRLVSRTCR